MSLLKNFGKSGREQAGWIARILLLFCLCFSFVGCGTKVVLTTGFGKEDVFVVGTEVCTLPEVRVYLTNVQNQYESVYGEEIWDAQLDGVTLEENVKETVLARIAKVKTMYLISQDRGITLDEEEEALVKAAAISYESSLNETEKEILGIDRELLEKLYRELALANKTYETMIADINPEISDDEARSVKVQYLYLRTVLYDGAGNRIAFSVAEQEKVRLRAEELYLEARAGADFEQLILENGDNEETSISFSRGMVDQNIENAAFSLENGQISEILRTEDGFYLLKCISTLDREETDANKEKIIETRRQETFEAQYDAYVDSLVRNLNESLWDSVELIRDPEVKTSTFFEIYESLFSEEPVG